MKPFHQTKIHHRRQRTQPTIVQKTRKHFETDKRKKGIKRKKIKREKEEKEIMGRVTSSSLDFNLDCLSLCYLCDHFYRLALLRN
tara:strand:+ start:486 stop:740 length:255 start_codon:yes stop_codon:yes gene_type:complete